MTVILSVWWLPVGLTAVTWIAAIFWPLPAPTGGMFDFGRPLAAMAHGLIAIFVTLLIWLAFFAGMWALDA